MARPKGVKNKLKEDFPGIIEVTSENFEQHFPTDIQPQIVEVIKEVIVEKFVDRIVEIPAKKIKGFALYKQLKDNQFPQGGMGQTYEDPNGTEKVYVPRPEEIYAQFIGNPEHWEELRDALARTWMEFSMRK